MDSNFFFSFLCITNALGFSFNATMHSTCFICFIGAVKYVCHLKMYYCPHCTLNTMKEEVVI